MCRLPSFLELMSSPSAFTFGRPPELSRIFFAMALAMETSLVARLMLKAMRGLRAPMATQPAGPSFEGPKSGVRSGSVEISDCIFS